MNTTTPDTLAHRVIAQRVHVIGDDDEALAVVRRIAPRLARESAERDTQRRQPGPATTVLRRGDSRSTLRQRPI